MVAARTSVARSSLASMGPRSFDRGNAPRSPSASERGRASMGPRSFDRGNTCILRSRCSTEVASMGPRSFDRGNLGSSCGMPADHALQWGRDRSIAEMRSLARVRAAMHGLQWGRDQLIAEMRTRSGCRQGQSTVLQWGRDHSIAEIARRSSGATREDLASMGPRSIRSRK